MDSHSKSRNIININRTVTRRERYSFFNVEFTANILLVVVTLKCREQLNYVRFGCF